VDQFFPRVGEAALRLIEQAGRPVVFPEGQTCCGQPAFNTGFRQEARALARRFVTTFEPFDEIVTPSGSCASMVRVFYPELFREEADWAERARRLGRRVFELTEYLDARGFCPAAGSSLPLKLTCHDSCHMLRELKLSAEPRSLLRRRAGVEILEMEGADVCCGFGGAFSVKLPEISASMLEAKLAAAEATGAEMLVGADCGCLMHLGGALRRRGSRLRTAHVAEVLAGMV
jgi:L-lactate dehydrogenase complex protein LldE